MSQKVSLSAWLGDEEDIPMADLMTIPSSPPPRSTSPPAEDSELFKELLAEIGVPSPTSASPAEDQSAEALLAMSPVSSIGDPGSPVYQETMSQLVSEPSSPMVSGVDNAPVGNFEEQALALLESMGCMEFTTNQEPSGTQVITITLPMIEDQMTIQQQPIQPPDSPSSIDSSMPASPEESPMPSPSPTPKRTKSKPKLKNTSPIEKKSRKRDQNKNAATRYRVKKRIETDAVEGELKGLENTNRELKDKAEGLEKEIKYLKDLLIEVRVLKGTISNIKAT